MKRNLFSVTSEFDSKTVLSVGSFVLIATTLSTILPLNSTMGEQTTTIESNINKARQVIQAFNTGNVSNVSEFISPLYFNHESQIDPVRESLEDQKNLLIL